MHRSIRNIWCSCFTTVSYAIGIIPAVLCGILTIAVQRWLTQSAGRLIASPLIGAALPAGLAVYGVVVEHNRYLLVGSILPHMMTVCAFGSLVIVAILEVWRSRPDAEAEMRKGRPEAAFAVVVIGQADQRE